METAHVLRVRLRVVLLQNGGVLSQQSLLLLLDDVALTGLFLSLKLLLGELRLTLLLVNRQLLLPESLDLALVFQFTHATPLRIHLLQSVILCELLHQLALELFLHAFLLFGSLSLKSELVLAGCLELLTDTHTLLSLSSLLRLGGFLSLLHVQFVSQLLLEGLLRSSLLLLSGKLLEDLITDGFSLLLHGLDFILSGLLLLGVPAHHFVLVLVHLSLALEQCSLFVLREDHICLTLLLLLLDDACLLVVLFNHALNNCIDLRFLSKVLLVCLLTGNIGIINLFLDRALVRLEILQLLLVLSTFHLIANLLVLQHCHIDLGVLLLQSTIK